jgi:hypothetical protein
MTRASYLDLYILGSYGAGRKQIQVNNQYDNGCLYGVSHTTWVSNVKKSLATTGPGGYDFLLDPVPHSHEISENTVERVIDPALGITASVRRPDKVPSF